MQRAGDARGPRPNLLPGADVTGLRMDHLDDEALPEAEVVGLKSPGEDAVLAGLQFPGQTIEVLGFAGRHRRVADRPTAEKPNGAGPQRGRVGFGESLG